MDFPAPWKDIQEKINLGYVEPISHSRTHPRVPYKDYESEISGSMHDLKNNLSFPSLSKSGSENYIYSWIEPSGKSDSMVRATLGASKYLCDRDTKRDQSDFSGWDDQSGLFKRVGYSIRMGSDGTENLTTLNNKFDFLYNNHGIYYLMCHPTKVDWSEGGYALNHLDYIKDKKDVWYVGLGHLYLYRFAATRAIAVTSL